jgi:hypothetical protein
MERSMFEHVTPYPGDPIPSLFPTFRKDPQPVGGALTERVVDGAPVAARAARHAG